MGTTITTKSSPRSLQRYTATIVLPDEERHGYLLKMRAHARSQSEKPQN